MQLLTTHFLVADPVPEPQSPFLPHLSFRVTPPVYVLDMTLYGVEHPFGPVQVTLPGYAASQFLFLCVPPHRQSMRHKTNKQKKSLTSDKQNLAKPQPSVYYQHYSHFESKIQHRTSC